MTMSDVPPRPLPWQLEDLAALPIGLSSLVVQDRWINWNYVWKKNKWDKIPTPGEWNKSENWLTHAEAVARKQHTGIGFVLGPDCDIAAIDLDDIRRDNDGDAEWAKPFIEKAFALGAYVEATVSAKGGRIIGRTQRAEFCSHEVKGIDGPKSGFEIYRRRSKYITVSGGGEGDASVVIDEIIDALLRAYPQSTAPAGWLEEAKAERQKAKEPSNVVSLNLPRVAAQVLGGIGEDAPKEGPPLETQHEIDKLWSVLNYVGADGKRLFDPDCSYGDGKKVKDDWLGVLMALHSTGWVCAQQLADNWSAQAKPGTPEKPGKYVQGEVAKKFASFERGRNGITERSLYRAAIDTGWTESAMQPLPGTLQPSPAVQQGPPPDSSGAVLRLADWLTRDLEPADPVMGNWLTTTSRVMLYAKTGLGKTLFLGGLGMRTAAGVGFLHWHGQKPRRVLYIDGEMSRRLFKQRLVDEAKRLGLPPPEGFFALSHEDVENWAPLNTAQGQAAIEAIIQRVGGVDLIIFDNIMSLILGDMKDEEPWRQTLPWQHGLTKRKIGQLWAHHTGLNETHAYGTKTREWQLDTVMGATEVERPDTDVNFQLTFTKARERTPQIRAEFEPVTIALVNDKWEYNRKEPVEARQKPSPEGQKFLDALESYPRNFHVSTKEWQEECIKRGLIDRDWTPKKISTLTSKYRRELIARNWIVSDEVAVWKV